jgi:hydrogenase/urease accessory protein HupE
MSRSMHRYLPLLLAALAIAAAPLEALAHEGHHETMSFTQAARHVLTQPDHLAMLALLAILVGYGGWRLYRGSR